MASLIMKIFDKIIKIETNSKLIEKYIKQSFSYINIKSINSNIKTDSTLKIIISSEIYNNNRFIKLCEDQYTDSRYKALYHRDNMIFIMKKEHLLYLILDKKQNIDITFIEKIISSIISKLLQLDDTFFIRASCVSKGGKAVAIAGDSKTGKTTIMCWLLQNGYNMLSNDKIGLRYINNKVEVVGIPISIGIRQDTIDKCFCLKSKKKIINNINYKNFINNEFKNGKSDKFNIQVDELINILGSDIVLKSNLKCIIVNEYDRSQKDLKIKYLNKNKFEKFLLMRQINGMYPSMEYINTIYRDKKVTLNREIFSKIKIVKIWSNEYNYYDLYKIIEKLINT